MGVAELAQAHYRRRIRLARSTARRILALWRQVEPQFIALSWRQRLPEALAVLAAAQDAAAAQATPYVDAVTGEGGPEVNPAAFAGIASDGRDLLGLLRQPAVTALTGIRDGVTVPRALTAGAVELDMIVRTQVADAGRVADGAVVAARAKIGGYVRQLSLPSCGRCIILAGRWYRWNAGFDRHPRCDCVHVPAAEDRADDIRTEPRMAFESMSAAEQDRVFGRAGAEAIRDGADLSKVVNARRGMQKAAVFGRDVLLTTEGTTVRGDFGRARRDGPLVRRPGQRIRSTRAIRLMPEQIYTEARGDRDEAARLLRLHGYLR